MTKTITGVVLALLVIPPFILGGVYIEVFIALATAIASYEIAKLNAKKVSYVFVVMLFIAIEAMAHVPISLFTFVAAVFLIVLFVLEVSIEEFRLDQVAYSYLIATMLALAWLGVFHIYENGYGGFGMLYVAIACYTCDSGAYFFGMAFGKHKLSPRISPNKTWEGAIGGYFCGVVFSLLVAMKYCPTMPLNLVYTASLALPAMAEIGDLAFSSIKRHFNLKDFGNLLPEHGGVLDRIDSLVFCLMLFNGLMLLLG